LRDVSRRHSLTRLLTESSSFTAARTVADGFSKRMALDVDAGYRQCRHARGWRFA
jgi:hypothetical protein